MLTGGCCGFLPRTIHRRSWYRLDFRLSEWLMLSRHWAFWSRFRQRQLLETENSSMVN